MDEKQLISIDFLQNKNDNEYEANLTIKHLLDVDTKEIINAKDILYNSQEKESFQIRHTLLLAQKSKIYKYKCAFCHEPVQLKHRKFNNYQQETWFFSHFKGNNNTPCPFKTENESKKTFDFNFTSFIKESELHKDIIKQLIEILEHDKLFSEIHQKILVRDSSLMDRGRKPDVISKYYSGGKYSI